MLPHDEVMVVTASGKVTRLAAEDIPEQARRTKGVQLVQLGRGDRVVEVHRTEDDGGGDEEGGVPVQLSPGQLELLSE